MRAPSLWLYQECADVFLAPIWEGTGLQGTALCVVGSGSSTMAFTFAAFCYMLSLVLCAALIFFAIWHVSNLLPASNSHLPPSTPPRPTSFPLFTCLLHMAGVGGL